jgi:hypothetical protein
MVKLGMNDDSKCFEFGRGIAKLLERVSAKFIALGGTIREPITRRMYFRIDGSAIDIGPTNEPITTRLVLDCMGNGSPISAQQRYVGSCAAGY